jgi:hypothetical protein
MAGRSDFISGLEVVTLIRVGRNDYDAGLEGVTWIQSCAGDSL